MENFNLEHFNKYTEIINYHIDDSEINKNSKKYESSQQIKNSFFNKIYYKRDAFEDAIKKSISEREQVLSIEGIEGCGKSTILKKVISDLNRPHLIMDFNQLAINTIFRKPDSIAINGAIAEHLEKNLMASFFMDDKPNFGDLCEFLLFEKNGLLAADFSDERLELRDIYIKNNDRQNKMHNWYKERQKTSCLVDLNEKVRKKYNYLHLIMAISHFLNLKEEFIIMFDNIDRLPRECQPYYYDFATGLNNNFKQYIKIIICIRPENAHMPQALKGGTKSDLVDHMALGYIESKGTSGIYLDSAGFHSILSKRQKYYIEQKFKNSELSEKIIFLTDELRSTYAELVLIDLANQSIRTALDYHCKFLEYLLCLFPFEKLKQTIKTLRASFLVSCLLAWIVDYAKVLDDQSLNLVSLLRKSINSKYRDICCDLSYLILVNLLNEGRNKIDREIKFGTLVENLNMLRFDTDEIRKEVYNLYCNGSQEFGHIISISYDEELNDESDIGLNTKLSLNFRGRRIVEDIAITFTFINRFLYKEKNKDKTIIDSSYFESSNYIAYTLENIDFFAQIAFLHTLELVRICKKMKIPNWLNEYKKRFCIQHKLQLERILESNISFIGKLIESRYFNDEEKQKLQNCINIMQSLLQLYRRQVDEIKSDTTVIYDFEAIVHEMLDYGKSSLSKYYNEGKDISQYLY